MSDEILIEELEGAVGANNSPGLRHLYPYVWKLTPGPPAIGDRAKCGHIKRVPHDYKNLPATCIVCASLPPGPV